ncbi:dipicolinate synthase subunit B [Clostridia bacterium]|nr:dipicolinate synthase subunit B [Clostridia bacterium]
MKPKLGWCVTASFCTFEKTILEMDVISEIYDIIPIMSFNSVNIDSRYGKASEHIRKITDICGREPIITIEDAEPIGPKNMTDIMLIAPCTGNTLAKLAHSITDTPVTMAIKSHLRNNKPVVIALSTNDALAGTMKNIAEIANIKNYYFVPLVQDDIISKPTSLSADLDKIESALEFATLGTQLRPMIV